MKVRSIFVGVFALVGGARVVAAQSAPVRITLHIPSNVDVRAYAPDSARFSLDGADAVSPGDTLTLRDGVALSYDRSSGPIHLLVRNVRAGQTVDITASGEHKSRWAAFVTHDVAISGRGELLQVSPVGMPLVATTDRERAVGTSSDAPPTGTIKR